MVKEAIGLDVERQASFTLAPGGPRNRTSVIVVLGRRSLYGERAKAVFTLDQARRLGQAAEIEWFSPYQLTSPAKRRGCEIVCAYEVAIAARDCAITRVKLITHFKGCCYPYVVRKNGVHRSSESERVPLLRHAQPGGLPACVYSSVCPPSAYDRDRRSAQP